MGVEVKDTSILLLSVLLAIFAVPIASADWQKDAAESHANEMLSGIGYATINNDDNMYIQITPKEVVFHDQVIVPMNRTVGIDLGVGMNAYEMAAYWYHQIGDLTMHIDSLGTVTCKRMDRSRGRMQCSSNGKHV